MSPASVPVRRGRLVVSAKGCGTPKINQGYFAPTYPQIRDIFYPTVERWPTTGLNVKINEGNKEVHFYAGASTENDDLPLDGETANHRCFKIGNALIDELDVMPAKKRS